MRTVSVLSLMVGMSVTAPALAQDDPSLARGARSIFISGGSPGSPSNGTSTVSATSIPQAMERADRADGAVSVSLGALYAGGDFGSDADTDIQSYALGARFRRGAWRLSASLPYMRIRSDAAIFTGIDSTPVLVAPGTAATRRTSRGLGDLTLGAAYTIEPRGGGPELELSGRVKLNTASRSSGLSSGETDYALGAQLSLPRGRFAPFASATYRILGDSRTYDLRDGFAASAGTSIAVGPRALILTSYHYARAATRFVKDSHELFAGASAALPNGGFRLTGFGTAGLSSGAASVSAGLALSKAF